MDIASHKLATKLGTISAMFLLVACLAIGLTVLESWNLEGAGAAINALGSERMRSYRIAYLLADESTSGDQRELRAEMVRFEEMLRLIRRGDPQRPLYLPKSETVFAHMQNIENDWMLRLRPLIERTLAESDPRRKVAMRQEFRQQIDPFVARIDSLVYILERHGDNNLSTLRSLQVGLVVLALLGTFVLIGLMYLVVVRPIRALRDGMQSMQKEDFSVRMPVASRDELGELATGFNNMAGHLQQLYDTLEERVRNKTKSLEEHRDELKTLYEVTALFTRAQSPEEMCREFLVQLMAKYGAAGGSVRLVDRMERQIHLFVQQGLTPDFAAAEQCLQMGECYCGELAAQHSGRVHFVDFKDPQRRDFRCHQAGYGSVLALPILLQGRSVGLCNLFFREPRVLSFHENQLLETLAQHLGIAIESLRMIAAEKELAISAERNLLAQELHDSIAQSLAFLNLQVQMLEGALEQHDFAAARDDLARIRAGVQESYDDVRELLVHFRTRVTQSDLETELARSLHKFETQSGIRTAFVQSGAALPLPLEQQAQMLYIVQEALSNVRKHAEASSVEVELHRGDEYVITIRDNGRGLDAELLDNGRHGGIGMTIMRERAERIGSQLEIRSAQEQGAIVTLRVPVSQNKVV